MPGTTNEGEIARANALRQKIEAQALRYGSEALKITTTTSVASYPIQGDNVQTVLKSADEALYRAKVAERKRVCEPQALQGDELSKSAEVEPAGA